MWMTIDETAQYLKVSKETIYRLAQKGDIPASKLGNQWRFNRNTIDEWLSKKATQQSDVEVTGTENKNKNIGSKPNEQCNY
jgi:excisionase family DNA binding protein